jgi:hypothetical protein
MNTAFATLVASLKGFFIPLKKKIKKAWYISNYALTEYKLKRDFTCIGTDAVLGSGARLNAPIYDWAKR